MSDIVRQKESQCEQINMISSNEQN